jgi:TonB family protein
MFGAPDDTPLLEIPEPTHSRLATLLDEPDEEAPWPEGPDRSVMFFLNERISPRSFRLRDRTMFLALVVTAFFHLLLLSQLRAHSLLQRMLEADAAARAAAKKVEDNTPFFELVELPKQRRERPSRPQAPASDLDRRAHGGVGAPDFKPGIKGTTPELHLSPETLAAILGTRPGSNADQQGKTQATTSPEKEGEGEKPAVKLADRGADAVLMVPKEESGSGAKPLKGLPGYGAGPLGGGIPDRRGGQVDLGPLSFDTEWYDWGPYAAEMLRRIRYHWDIPEIAMLGVQGVVRIHFFIERDGRVTGLTIESGSGRPPLDFAARDAILNASPLPPLPDDLVGVMREGVTISFYYNTRVPERSEQG